MNASDHNLMRRLAIGVLALFAGVDAYHRLYLLYAHKFFDVTGRAQWIWAQHQLSRNIPVAFFATRNFDLPPNRQFTRIKVAVDPEYTLYFNGPQIGRWNFLSQRPGTFASPLQKIVAPRAAFSFKTAIPEIRDINGVPVVVPRPTAATAYDFGGTRGRARFAINYDNGVARSIRV